MTLVLRYAARSDRGLVRANNEDSVYAGARLLALADGMGGHAAGEIASQLMIAALAPLDNDEPGGELLGKLGSAIRAGNETIADQVEESPELEGMGTTLTAILFGGSKLGLAHVGDSRAYLLRDGQLTQITRDDTFVQSLVDEGRITAEQAHNHPQRSLIMRALTGNEVEPTLTVREARVGDRYLLCSDGLSDVVSHETIATTLGAGDHNQAADKLVELALRSGGPDNVTVIVADVIDVDFGQSRPIVAGAASHDDDEDYAPPNTAAGRAAAMRPPRAQPKRIAVPAPAEPPRKRRVPWVLLALTLLALLVVGAIVGRAVIRSSFYVGESDSQVVVLQGVDGSLLGYDLYEVVRTGCVTDKNELRVLDVGQAAPDGCSALRLEDLRPAARTLVTDGMVPGNLDSALVQFERLRAELLPVCPPAKGSESITPSTPATTEAPATAEAPATTEPGGPVTPTPTPTPVEGTPATTIPTTSAAPVPGQTCRTVR